jgi:hypothetical protein
MCLVGHHQMHLGQENGQSGKKEAGNAFVQWEPHVLLMSSLCGVMIVHYRYHFNLLWFHVAAHYSDHQLIGKKKKTIFLEIKFHLNENIEWHCMQLEFNFNWNEFKLILLEIKFHLNENIEWCWMQLEYNTIQYYLIHI